MTDVDVAGDGAGFAPPTIQREQASSTATTAPADTEAGHGSARRLSGNLGVIAIVFMVLAFNAPATVAAGFVPLVIGYGNQLGAPSTFVLTGVILMLFAVGMVAMSRFMHSPGAFYSYIVSGLGRIPGLGGAFTAILTYVAFGITMTIYGGTVTESMVHDTFGGPDIRWWVWALLLAALACTMALFHIELSAKVLGVALTLEIGVVAAWALRIFFTGGAHGIPVKVFTPHAFTSGSLSIGLLFGVLCVTGFETVAVFRDETKDPQRTIPRATYASVIIMCGLYAIVAWAYIAGFGVHSAVAKAQADPAGSFTASVHSYLGTFAFDLVSVLLVTSSFASLNSLNNIGARYLYSLGRDHVLPKRLGFVHRKHGSPSVAVLAFAAICVLGTLIPTWVGANPLTTYADTSGIGALCLLILMTWTSVGVLSFFRRRNDHTANIWQSVIAPALAIFGLGGVTVLAIIHLPVLIGGSRAASNAVIAVIAAIILIGCVLAGYYKARRPDVYRRIGSQDL
jgi:amino acid transporter